MVKIPNMLEENIDYELIPAAGEHWHVRIKQGEFIECTVSFGAIKVDEVGDKLNFDFTLHSTPDPELTVDNLDLQRYVGKVLESVMITNINEMEKKG